MRVLVETPAQVICSVEGACMSAATMIFLSGNAFEISEHSMFMFHNYSSMIFGKGGEMYDNIIHERKWSEKIMRQVYSGFLTEIEIKAILDNKDIWMDGEEVIKRLKTKQKMLESPNPKRKKSPISTTKKRVQRTKKDAAQT
jgi:ATP-dependent protease ClpP protease subunit